MKSIQQLLVLLLLFGQQAYAKVRLPALVGNHMVLQRNTPLTIWGWADAKEKVTVSIQQQHQVTKADASGQWRIQLQPMIAGGPYTLTVKGSNTITLRDVLIGDVWLCGGQSNMGWKLSWGVTNFEEEIKAAEYPQIRLFHVKEVLSYQPEKDIQSSQGWQLCSPTTVGNFSAVAYFFGRHLYQRYRIPIGLLSANWGGTPAEAWISPEALKKVPAYKSALTELQSLDKNKLQQRFEQRLRQWALQTKEGDPGFGAKKWYESDLDTKNWKQTKLPDLWENSVLPDYDGPVWFRKEINLSPENEGKEAMLSLGHPDDSDSTWFNGVLIGGQHGNNLRTYKIPAHLVKAGRNVLTVRILDYGAEGGLRGTSDDLFAQFQSARISLEGDWLYQKGGNGTYTAGWPPRPPEQNMNELTVLYNAMIAPITTYRLKGVIFYQGEANVNRAEDYLSLFTALIQDWRTQWQQDLPFIFAQLSTYLPPPVTPEESKWAQLREAQLKALNLVPHTAMAVTIDIGSKDVHPRNKQDVGKRLGLAAQHIAYGEKVVFSGPIYSGMQIERNKIRLSFSHTGTGLMVKDKYGYLKGFSIARRDKKFVWAKAQVEGNTVVVWNDSILDPTAVRYGWASNPDDLNLYNSEGLPASPFRTDD